MPAKKSQKQPLPGGAARPLTRAKNFTVWHILILWALIFAAYSNSFEAGLIFDNAAIIGGDPRIETATAASAGRIFTEGYWYGNTTSGLYRPATTLSYLFNYAVLGEGLHPAGYHLVNLALHCGNAALVYALGILLFEAAWPALGWAALWALHPLLTESVTNIVGRADLLAGCGVLAGLSCYIRWTRSSGRNRAAWMAGVIAAQTIGLFSKESAAILPAVLVLYDLIWPRAEAWGRRLIPYAALAVPFAAFFLLRAQLHAHLVVPFSENPLIGAGFWTARITAAKVIGKFVWLFLWPAKLSADYSFNAVPLFGWRLWDGEDFKALIALGGSGGLLYAGFRSRRKNPRLAFFLGFFFLALAPTANVLLTIGSIMAERFMYLPALGLAGCVMIGIGELRVGLQWTAVGVLCLALGARTYARNFDWRDDTSLWSSAIEAYPEAARPHNNLGNAMLSRSEIAGATAEFEAALRIRPDYAEAHYNLGKALSQTPGGLERAIGEYEAALRYRPDYSPKLHDTNVHVSLGNALARVPGRLPEAIEQFQEALKVDPDSSEAYYNMGNALAQTPGRMADAMAAWRAALRIRPDLAEAHYNLGVILSQSPEGLEEAVAEYQAAARIRPDYAEAHQRLGMALLQQGRTAEAIAELETALRIRPDARGEQLVQELRARQKQ